MIRYNYLQHDGKPIENEDIMFMNDRQQLHIESATEEDAGEYLCTAENKPGIAEKSLTVSVLPPPKMIDDNRVFEVLENDTRSLECPLEDKSDPSVEIRWLKNGIPVTTSANLQLSTSGNKIHLMHGQVSDSGNYTCLANNAAGHAKSNMAVIVLVPPRIIGPTLQKLETNVGKAVEIKCETTGIPQPEITWLFDGRPIFESDRVQFFNNGSILRLNDVQSSQEGRYTCHAENKVNKAEADTFLRVNAQPRFVTLPDDLKVIQGHSQTIRCEVVGAPLPTVEWLKDGQTLESPMIQSLSNLHYIHIRNASLEDAGNYTCIATNRAGKDMISIKLHVLVPPLIASSERLVQVKENTTLSLDCVASGNPIPKISWLRNGVPMKFIEGSRLTIGTAKGADAGSYSCEAANEAGKATANFEVDVFIKPRFKTLVSDVRVQEGDRARLECKAEGHPTPIITWLRGGRPIEAMQNFILSPHGETLMILKARRSDAGSYSCVAENFAGSTEAPFRLTILVKPYIDEIIDQNPRVVINKSIILRCPVLGISKPIVEWRYKNRPVSGASFKRINEYDLEINGALESDAGRYTCYAENEAGNLSTDFELEVIGPPKWPHDGNLEYEVKVDDTITMDCTFHAEPKPEIIWYHKDSPLYLSDNKQISPNGEQLTIRGAQLSDGGKYTCEAKNEAGTSEVDIQLKVLVPPKIDKSNVIGNPLANAGSAIFLECPVTGIPQPTVRWYREGDEIDLRNPRLSLNQDNQTFGISSVAVSDEGHYYCLAENKGGEDLQEFDLEVLVAPEMENLKPQKIVRREDDHFALICPVKRLPENRSPVQILWYKDNRPVDTSGQQRIKLSNDAKRLHITKASETDTGKYSCYAYNRAGERHMDFTVEILCRTSRSVKYRNLEKVTTEKLKIPELSHGDERRKIACKLQQPTPKLSNPNNDLHPHVMLGNPVTLWCTATGHPVPIIRWYKDGREETSNKDNGIRFLDGGQGLEILEARAEHRGVWKCVAENDAGKVELDLTLDVWTTPIVTITPKNAIKPLGEPVTLICKADGNPPSSLTWLKDGLPLVSSIDGARISMKGSRLDIPRLQKSHVGDYTCEANNEAGPGADTAFVDVLVPPVINREGIDMSPRLPVSHTPTLYCEASGKPFPEIQWYFNNTELVADAGKIVIGDGGRYIQIINISLADRGIYKCVAKNTVNLDELIYSVSVFQIPSILNGGTTQVIEGGTATVVCDAIGEPSPLIHWQRNGLLVDTVPEKYTVNDKNLTIEDVRTSDSGIYLCTATNEAGEARQAFTLEVFVPPRITLMSPSESVVKANEPFSLRCGSSGYPEPEITWEWNKTIIADDHEGYNIADDGTLFVSRAEPDSVYKLKCIATNGAGEDSKSYTVKAMTPPNIAADVRRIMINATEGNDTSLFCQIAGEKTEIKWLKNGSPLELTRNMSVTSDSTTLRFLPVRLADEGVYTCVATNIAGNASQELQLFVGTPPQIETPNLKVEAKAGDEAVIECEAIGIPLPKITWMKDEEEIQAPEAQVGSKSRLVFESVTNEDSALYSCIARNWVGKVYKDINLVVYVPPQVYPKQMEIAVAPGEDVILTCNASGIPEPIVTWTKAPNITIAGKDKKYQMVGTSLYIPKVVSNDEGFYQCAATTSTGVAYGIRNLKVGNSTDSDIKQIWVRCDENGNPVVDSYVQDRGDVPEDQDKMLPTGRHQIDVGGDGKTIKRCLYTPRGTRMLHYPPHITEGPKSQVLRPGTVTEIHCRADGFPMPVIRWLKDGIPIDDIPSKNGFSTLHVNVEEDGDPDLAGVYTCLAENENGEVAQAETLLKFESHPESSPLRFRSRDRNVIVFNCLDRGIPQKEYVTWTIDDEPAHKNDERFNIMNNGSLVVFDVTDMQVSLVTMDDKNWRFSRFISVNRPTVSALKVLRLLKADDFNSIKCYYRNDKRPKEYSKQLVKEELPRVIVHMKKYYTQVGESIIIDCHLESEPLTTKVEWTKNNLPLLTEDSRIRILANNSLSIKSLRPSDRASYKCRGKTRLGKMFDEVELIVQDGPEGVVGFIGGRLNNRRVTNQRLFMNLTPSIDKNAVFIKIDNLLDNQDTAGQAVIGYTSALCPLLAYDRDGEKTSDINPKFERYAEYEFDTGEKLRVRQTGNGMKGAFLKMEILVDGATPQSDKMDTVTFDDLQEEMIENEPGRIKGHGKSTLRINKDTRIPFHWKHTLNYDASKGMTLGPGKTLNLVLKTELVNDPRTYRVDASAKRSKQCPEGFGKMPNGYCEDINECEINPSVCGKEASCVNEEGGFKCVRECASGYKVKWDGSCIDIDECVLGTHDCPKGKQCLNLPGSFSCENECADGFFMNSKGQCEDIDECASSPCESPLTCLNQMGSHLCLCPNGLPENEAGGCRGVTEDYETSSRLIESDENNNDCLNGYVWNGVQCEDIDECAFDSPCQYECHNTPGSFRCECPEGYELEGNECIDIDECAETPCQDGQLCFNHYGDYECIQEPCPSGYRLENLECLPECQNCSLPPIRIHLITLPKGIRAGTSLLRLTAYDAQWRILYDTKYSVKASSRFQRRPPFALKANGGKAILQNIRPLLVNRSYKLGIKAISKSPYTKTKFSNEFLVFISVSDHVF